MVEKANGYLGLGETDWSKFDFPTVGVGIYISL
jgi:hypothetical protein